MFVSSINPSTATCGEEADAQVVFTYAHSCSSAPTDDLLQASLPPYSRDAEAEFEGKLA
jgi:hypothetical protein